jgi:hypothetical protein
VNAFNRLSLRKYPKTEYELEFEFEFEYDFGEREGSQTAGNEL